MYIHTTQSELSWKCLISLQMLRISDHFIIVQQLLALNGFREHFWFWIHFTSLFTLCCWVLYLVLWWEILWHTEAETSKVTCADRRRTVQGGSLRSCAPCELHYAAPTRQRTGEAGYVEHGTLGSQVTPHDKGLCI